MAKKTIGELSVLLGMDTEVYQSKMKKSKSDLQSFGDSAKNIAAKFAVAFAAIAGAVKSAEVVIKSTDSTADAFEATMGGLKEATNRFATSIATLNFTNFVQGLKDAYDAGVNYANQLDNIEDRQRSVSITSSEAELAIAKLNNESRQKGTSAIRQKEIASEIETIVNNQAVREKNLADQKMTAERDLIAARIRGIEMYANAEQSVIDAMTEGVIDYIKHYDDLSETQYNQVDEYVNAQKLFETLSSENKTPSFNPNSYNTVGSPENISAQAKIANDLFAGLNEAQRALAKLDAPLNLVIKEQRDTVAQVLIGLNAAEIKLEGLKSKAIKADNKNVSGTEKNIYTPAADTLTMEDWMTPWLKEGWADGNKADKPVVFKSIIDEATLLPKALDEALDPAVQKFWDFAQEANAAINSFTANMVETLAAGFGEAMVTGDWENFGASILQGFGNFAKQFGGLLIAYGMADFALKFSPDPVSKIAAGVALVALGSALSIASSASKNIGSSTGSFSGASSVGSPYSSSDNNKTFELIWRRAGKDLVAIMKDENTSYKTLTGKG